MLYFISFEKSSKQGPRRFTPLLGLFSFAAHFSDKREVMADKKKPPGRIAIRETDVPLIPNGTWDCKQKVVPRLRSSSEQNEQYKDIVKRFMEGQPKTP